MHSSNVSLLNVCAIGSVITGAATALPPPDTGQNKHFIWISEQKYYRVNNQN